VLAAALAEPGFVDWARSTGSNPVPVLPLAEAQAFYPREARATRRCCAGLPRRPQGLRIRHEIRHPEGRQPRRPPGRSSRAICSAAVAAADAPSLIDALQRWPRCRPLQACTTR
jgi:hypothetical protein